MLRLRFAIPTILAAALIPAPADAHEGCEFASMHSSHFFEAALERAGYEADGGWYRAEYRASLRPGYDWQARLNQVRRPWSTDRHWAADESLSIAGVDPDLSTVSVLEPPTWLIVLTGLAGLGLVAYRRREETLA